MEINYTIVLGVVLVLFVIWFFIRRRNRRDRIDLEREINQKNSKPKQHDPPHV